MTGLTDYTAQRILNYISGQTVEPALPSVWLALFTAVGADANTGFTEVSGNGYSRVQVAGPATAAGTISTASSTITMPNVSGFPWVQPGMSVYDATANAIIGTVLSWVGTTLTLTANASSNGSGSTDVLNFSAFSRSSGSAPSVLTNNAAVTFPAATGAGFGTVIAFGLFDAATTGNLLLWDFLGNFNWLPFEIPTTSNLATVKGNGMSSNDPVVFTAEYGGTLPTLSTGTMTGYTINFVATPATDTINIDTTSGPATPIVTTSSGSGMVRKIVQQSIPAGVTASFAAAQLNASAA
jgi:hypothetical protein